VIENKKELRYYLTSGAKRKANILNTTRDIKITQTILKTVLALSFILINDNKI